MGFRYSCGARRVAVLVFAISSLPLVVAHAQAVVRGVLYDDATGKPVSGAVMLVDPRSDAAVVNASADSTGVFSLQVGDGVYQIAAVRPGWKSVLSAPMSLQNGERLTVRVPIAQNGDPEHRIGVTEHVRPNGAAQGRSADLPSEVQSRRQLGMGLHYDREELTKNGQNTLGEFLRTVPGLNVSDPNSMSTAQMSRDAGLGGMSMRGGVLAPCHIGWFVDGHRMDLPGRNDPLTDGLGSMRLETIEAVEVFRGLSEMPAQFADPDLRCGAIAVWTRRG
jgi:hypothetical protein